MEISITSVLAQIINFFVLYFLYKKFVAKHVDEIIKNKKKLLYKLENAEEEYENLMDEAEKKAKKIYDEAITEKTKIINEGGLIAKNKEKEILESAMRKAELLVENAKEQGQQLHKSLEGDFIRSVKHTTYAVLKRLVKDEDIVQESYIEKLATELQVK